MQALVGILKSIDLMEKTKCIGKRIAAFLMIATGALLLITVFPFRSGQHAHELELFLYLLAGVTMIAIGIHVNICYYIMRSHSPNGEICPEWELGIIRRYKSGKNR